MVSPKKKLNEYLKKSVRKLRHRKGYGVHSPFAYAIITEVIEEKLPYYAYRRMQRTYDKQAPISHKVACLLLRLANRFKCRNVAELGCDGGYTILPLLLTDSRLQVSTYGSSITRTRIDTLLSWLPQRLPNVTVHPSFDELSGQGSFDMIFTTENPYLQGNTRPTPEQREAASAQLVEWLMAHAQENALICVKGIQPNRPNELLWDQLCDRDDVSITMDLYDYGLAILKPRFFKQHYVVAF